MGCGSWSSNEYFLYVLGHSFIFAREFVISENSLSCNVSSIKYTFSSYLSSPYCYLFMDNFYLWPLLRLCMHLWSYLLLQKHYLMTSLFLPHYKLYSFYFPFIKAILFYPWISHLWYINLNWSTHNDFYYYFSHFLFYCTIIVLYLA